jgi:two-component system nitrogen regulation response regulator GlnG
MSDPAQQKILIIDDETDVHYSFERLLAKDDVKVVTAANGPEGLQVLKKENPDIVVMDIRMGKESGLDVLREIRKARPGQIVIMMTAYGTSQTAIEAMKLGAYDYTLKPFEIPQLKDLLKRALRAARELSSDNVLAIGGASDDTRTGIVGSSSAMQQVYKLVGQVAPTDATVLVTGESGTGKELVAHAIHANSKRSHALFMAINCAAIPENLLESELFGHEKGSFTGAMAQRIGRFEQCDGGTLFLDEIGEMPLTVQSKLLRILQDGELLRVGGSKPIKVSVRIIAATNRNLWEASRKKEFREDLFYRLNVFSINLPPLRTRLGDVSGLVSFFMNKWRRRNNGGPARISEEALKILVSYHWPGNVRELENCVQRAAVLANGDTITPKDLPPEITEANQSPAANHESAAPVAITLAEAAKAIAAAANRDEADTARQLGIPKAALQKIVAKFGGGNQAPAA